MIPQIGRMVTRRETGVAKEWSNYLGMYGYVRDQSINQSGEIGIRPREHGCVVSARGEERPESQCASQDGLSRSSSGKVVAGSFGRFGGAR